MIQGVGSGSLAQQAIEAALRQVSQRSDAVGERVSDGLDAGALTRKSADGASFEKALSNGLHEIDASIKKTDELPLDLLSGKINDFHEVAGQVKQAEIAFKFALEVRNKLIEAYRETMRMNV